MTVLPWCARFNTKKGRLTYEQIISPSQSTPSHPPLAALGSLTPPSPRPVRGTPPPGVEPKVQGFIEDYAMPRDLERAHAFVAQERPAPATTWWDGEMLDGWRGGARGVWSYIAVASEFQDV